MLELFYSESCPYCRKVINYFNEHNIEHVLKDINERENFEKLMEMGKISQIPFLIDTDNNVMMYESDKIIDYAEKRKGK